MLHHRGGDECAHVAAEFGDFLDHGGIEIDILCAGHEEHGLRPRINISICKCHLEFVIKIGKRAEPADDRRRAELLEAVGDQPAVRHGLDCGNVLDCFFHHAQALSYGEKRVLVRIIGHDRDHLGEYF